MRMARGALSTRHALHVGPCANRDARIDDQSSSLLLVSKGITNACPLGRYVDQLRVNCNDKKIQGACDVLNVSRSANIAAHLRSSSSPGPPLTSSGHPQTLMLMNL